MIPKQTALGLLGQVILVGLALIHQLIAIAGAADTARPIRFATFNASLNRNAAGQLIADLRGRDNRQASRVAEIIQRVRPQILLINEFDYDPDGTAARLFQENYLNASQHGQAPIRYAEYFIAPVNTGVATGLDLDGDGRSDGPGDAFGFGRFPGQYGMLVLCQQQGDPALDTADFSERGPGNLRVDYVLPSRQLTIAAAGVYWPASDDPGYPLVQASDHRLVWVDVE